MPRLIDVIRVRMDGRKCTDDRGKSRSLVSSAKGGETPNETETTLLPLRSMAESKKNKGSGGINGVTIEKFEK